MIQNRDALINVAGVVFSGGEGAQGKHHHQRQNQGKRLFHVGVPPCCVFS